MFLSLVPACLLGGPFLLVSRCLIDTWHPAAQHTPSLDGGYWQGQEPDAAPVGVIFNVRAGPHSGGPVLGLGCPVPARWVDPVDKE